MDFRGIQNNMSEDLEDAINTVRFQLLDLNLVVAGTSDAVLMVESEAKELSEEIMLGAVLFGHEQIQAAIQAIEAMVAEVGKPKWDWQAPAKDESLAEAVERVAKMLQIEDLLNRKPAQLSGGQRQRVAIGRALARDPALFLFDEPLSNLDAKLRVEMRTEIKTLHQKLGASMVYVTHDQIEAMTMATHVGVLDEGRLVQFGSPREIYENPVSTYVASRLGLPRINLLPVSMFPGGPKSATTIGLRPEQIEQGSGKDAKVIRVEHLGDQMRLHLELEGQAITTLADPHQDYEAGDTLKIQPRDPLYFDANGQRI